MAGFLLGLDGFLPGVPLEGGWGASGLGQSMTLHLTREKDGNDKASVCVKASIVTQTLHMYYVHTYSSE